MALVTPTEPVPLDQLGRVHFAGIGGAGMSGIARIMLARGVSVSGSDAIDSATLTELRARGATVHVGQAAGQLGDADTLVVSSAIRADNPELIEAKARGLRVLHRAAALASLMSGRRVIAVTGTHGKTTTTSMITTVLLETGADPAYAIGGVLSATGTGAADGSGEHFVAEADESDGSFLMYSPDVAVITNVEADHLDNYGTEEAYRASFAAFLARLKPGGPLVTCADDAGTRDLAARARATGVRVVTYGESADADYQVTNVVTSGMETRLSLRAKTTQMSGAGTDRGTVADRDGTAGGTDSAAMDGARAGDLSAGTAARTVDRIADDGELGSGAGSEDGARNSGAEPRVGDVHGGREPGAELDEFAGNGNGVRGSASAASAPRSGGAVSPGHSADVAAPAADGSGVILVGADDVSGAVSGEHGASAENAASVTEGRQSLAGGSQPGPFTQIDFDLHLRVPGKHNALNAAAAFATAVELGVDPVRAAAALASYRGAARRLEPKGEAGGVLVLDTYAHHPTELAADLRAAREITAGRGRVIAVFQPHLYSRTRIFAAEFGAALGLADEAVVLDVYAAREDPEPGVTGRLVADAVPGGAARYAATFADAARVVASLAAPGDLVLTMGAGDITKLGPRLLDEIDAASSNGSLAVQP